MTMRRLAILLAALPMTGACSPTIDLGPATTGPYYPPQPPNTVALPGSVSLTDTSVQGGFSGFSETFVPNTIDIVGSELALSASAPPEDTFYLTVYAGGTGSFRCEDPAGAQRTMIEFDAPQTFNGLSLITVPSGTCTIEVTRYPTLADPVFEGTFSAHFSATPAHPNEGGFIGSFSVMGVTTWNGAEP